MSEVVNSDYGISLDVNGAVSEAKRNLASLFPEFSNEDVRLEEVETPLNGRHWKLTFSASLPVISEDTSLASLLRPRRTRKVVELAGNGQLISVKAA